MSVISPGYWKVLSISELIDMVKDAKKKMGGKFETCSVCGKKKVIRIPDKYFMHFNQADYPNITVGDYVCINCYSMKDAMGHRQCNSKSHPGLVATILKEVDRPTVINKS